MVLIDLIVNGQTCVAQNNFAQHDWSCMGPFSQVGSSVIECLQHLNKTVSI
jgi:hypothetical protein